MSREPKPRICENCIYLYNTSYEYSEYVCAAGVTEDDEHFTGDGCTYHWNKLRAMKNANDKLWGKAHTITEEDLKIFFPNVQPKTGRWFNIKSLLTASRCSECKSVFAERTNYCPKCGAKMEGEAE